MGKLDNVSKRVDTKLHNVQSVLAKAAAGILVVTEKLHTLKTSASLAVAENTKTDPDSLLDKSQLKCWPLMMTSLPFWGMLNKT